MKNKYLALSSLKTLLTGFDAGAKIPRKGLLRDCEIFFREFSFEALVMPLGGDELLPGFLVLSPDCGVATGTRAEQPVDSAVGRVLANITSHQVPGIETL